MSAFFCYRQQFTTKVLRIPNIFSKFAPDFILVYCAHTRTHICFRAFAGTVVDDDSRGSDEACLFG